MFASTIEYYILPSIFLSITSINISALEIFGGTPKPLWWWRTEIFTVACSWLLV